MLPESVTCNWCRRLCFTLAKAKRLYLSWWGLKSHPAGNWTIQNDLFWVNLSLVMRRFVSVTKISRVILLWTVILLLWMQHELAVTVSSKNILNQFGGWKEYLIRYFWNVLFDACKQRTHLVGMTQLIILYRSTSLFAHRR